VEEHLTGSAGDLVTVESDAQIEQHPADMTGQLKTVAAKLLTADQLTAFMAVADANRLTDDNGEIDEHKVNHHLRLFP
jgi:hypothetical protein